MAPIIKPKIVEALGGFRAGAGWMVPCPAHDDATPSLSVRIGAGGTMLVYCHAGCSQAAVIAALRDRQLWGAGPSAATADVPRHAARHDSAGAALRRLRASQLWIAAEPATGTPVETYLRARGLRLNPPDALRYHARLQHCLGGVWPAMIAIVVDGVTGMAIGVHRTYLARDGQGKAPVEPNKMMLGPCRGGAVRLADADGRLLIGEGIETCLAAMQATGRPAWAALSTSGLRALELPETITEVTVLADGDAPGEAAALAAARRWTRPGRRVRVARAPAGLDFNDVLLAREGGVP